MTARFVTERAELLKLRAEDAEDLAVIAACLQDAVVLRRDMTYRPKERRFAAVLNRFRWEKEGADAAARRGERIRAGLHFDHVGAVKTRHLESDGGAALELLTIEARPDPAGGAEITLVFAGGGEIKLAAECVDCSLDDLTEPWSARARPAHPIDESGAKD
ncbi:MAG: DUF2948 family protein [Alphaproteobacteria bacterium]|nr:DUF2948 family protein [Alphaproteobacteria bacterium]